MAVYKYADSAADGSGCNEWMSVTANGDAPKVCWNCTYVGMGGTSMGTVGTGKVDGCAAAKWADG